MKNIKLKKGSITVVITALVATFAVFIPGTAQAAGVCTTNTETVVTGNSSKSITYKQCVGTDYQGANYEIRMPNKFFCRKYQDLMIENQDEIKKLI